MKHHLIALLVLAVVWVQVGVDKQGRVHRLVPLFDIYITKAKCNRVLKIRKKTEKDIIDRTKNSGWTWRCLDVPYGSLM